MLWILLCLLTFVCSDARCMYRPPNELVPKDLVYGIEGGIDEYGHYESRVVFDWSKAVSYYSYSVIESIPAKDATNVTLGSTNARQSDERTPLAIFTRMPGAHNDEDEPLDNENSYRLTVEVYSDCDMSNSITQATYIVDLKATYEFTHNYTKASTFFTHEGWQQPAQLVMHPDVYRELEYIVIINQSHFIELSSTVHITGGDNNGTCSGEDNIHEKPCYAMLNVTIKRTVGNVPEHSLEPLTISYALSEFSQSGANTSGVFNNTKPANFNVSRVEPIQSGSDYRYDICEGKIDTAGNVYTRARSSAVEQNHTVTLHTITATCKYRIFMDQLHFSPLAYIIGWFDYDYKSPFQTYHNHSLLGSSMHAFMV